MYLQDNQHIANNKPRTRSTKPRMAANPTPTQPKKTIQVNFGPGAVQDKIYNFKDNYISTTKYRIFIDISNIKGIH